MTWLKYRWKEEEVLQWLQQRSLSQEISLLGEHPKEQQLTIVASLEEQAFSRFQACVRRRLLKALRQGDYPVLHNFSP